MNLNGKRIAVGGFLHETNTFQEQKTTYADFAEAGDRTPLPRGPDVLERFSGLNTSVAGALEVLKTTRATLVPLPRTSATPSGRVTGEPFERLAAVFGGERLAGLPVDRDSPTVPRPV